MIAVIGKAMFWFLTSCAVVGVTAQIIRGPNGAAKLESREGLRRTETQPKKEDLALPVRPHCDYIQFAQKADTTFWQAECSGGALPWDSSYAKWRADP